MTSPALGSDDLTLDQSGTSIQILPEPNAGDVTRKIGPLYFTKKIIVATIFLKSRFHCIKKIFHTINDNLVLGVRHEMP